MKAPSAVLVVLAPLKAPPRFGPRRLNALMELRSGQRMGHMTAQRKDPPSPPAGKDTAAPVQAPLIQAPATPGTRQGYTGGR